MAQTTTQGHGSIGICPSTMLGLKRRHNVSPWGHTTSRAVRHQSGGRRGLGQIGRSLMLAVAMLMVSGATAAAIAQSATDRAVGALAYPTGSQRFFEAGVAQLEREVERLLQQSQDLSPKLSIEADLVRSQEQFRLQQDQWLEDRLSRKIEG